MSEKRTVTFGVTEIEYQALRLRAAQKSLRTDDDAVNTTARDGLLECLEMEDRLRREDVVKAVVDGVVQKNVNGYVEAAKARQEVRVDNRKELTMPNEIWMGKPSATYAVWAALAKEQLNQKTWSSFSVRDMAHLAGIPVKVGSSSSQTLISAGWIVESGKDTSSISPIPGNLYTFTQKARAWFMVKENQKKMLELGILEPIEEAPKVVEQIL